MLRLCTTPKVLANMREAMTEPEEIHGFDALKDEDQERIRAAWSEGELPQDEKAEGEGSQGEEEEEAASSKDTESSKKDDK